METIKIQSAVFNAKVEVKKCPFCGGSPRLSKYKTSGIKLICDGCGIGIKQKTTHFDLQWLEVQLIKIYNTRS